MKKIHVVLVDEVIDLVSQNDTLAAEVHNGVLALTTWQDSSIRGRHSFSKFSVPLHRVVSWTEDWG
jgi:hypothetical protein